MTTTAGSLSGADWFKSSYSNDHGGQCVEGARLPGGAMAVRDSKNPHGPAFTLTGNAWTAFIGALSNGEF
ncbi:DUF397 domain-containing protein [Streptomyces sp. NPDC006645]|uniref:DUF397 domain-containing protein n=1 Tax=unclassified Streptomyces TaxID=2593676 RepID=UPI0033A91E4C